MTQENSDIEKINQDPAPKKVGRRAMFGVGAGALAFYLWPRKDDLVNLATDRLDPLIDEIDKQLDSFGADSVRDARNRALGGQPQTGPNGSKPGESSKSLLP